MCPTFGGCGTVESIPFPGNGLEVFRAWGTKMDIAWLNGRSTIDEWLGWERIQRPGGLRGKRPIRDDLDLIPAEAHRIELGRIRDPKLCVAADEIDFRSRLLFYQGDVYYCRSHELPFTIISLSISFLKSCRGTRSWRRRSTTSLEAWPKT
jgi:hypothetical protein